ncbi:DUF2487 family protein [Paenibacillus senegalensis]|uniref:DUF2487 family protein n=1 Tax=Paenibacillus senegalensis TaxID=1465766 RepID=UPI000288B688|nr:DUF2487 family protein [Paenibacillus senegalensis]
MKFSEVNKEQWEELRPYMDTCLLPITGLTGDQNPWQVTEELEKLRDIMDYVEFPFKGRIVTYPALHYVTYDEAFIDHVNRLCLGFKELGFRYVIVISSDSGLNQMEFSACDLFIRAKDGAKGKLQVRELVEACWSQEAENSTEDE